MSRAIKILTLIDLIFLVILMLSGSLSGILSDVAYAVAFLLPFAIGFAYSKRLRYEREEERGIADPPERFFYLNKKSAKLLLPLLGPSVAVVFVLAALTSLFLTALGFSNQQPTETRFFEMLVVYALAPAVLEEMLFRYMPMKLLLPYSPRFCVLISALFFALIHANLFQMPYAFVAGIIFMTLNLTLDSFWPSFILHFVNNVLSVIWMKYCVTMHAMLIFVGVLLSVVLISLIFIMRRKDEYRKGLKKAFRGGTPVESTNAPIALVVISLYIALMNLFT